MTMRQTFVNTAPARGIPGDSAGTNPEVHMVGNPVASGGPVTAGQFVWLRGTTGAGLPLVSGTTATSARPLGVVARALTHTGADVGVPGGEAGSLSLPEGSPVRVVVNGDVFAVSRTSAVVSQAVFAHTDGSGLSTSAPGTGVAGAVDTGWRVSIGGNAGDVIVISNWGRV